MHPAMQPANILDQQTGCNIKIPEVITVSESTLYDIITRSLHPHITMPRWYLLHVALIWWSTLNNVGVRSFSTVALRQIY